MNQHVAVPIDQQIHWYGREIGRAKASMADAVGRGKMRPETRELIERNQASVYESLKRLRDIEAAAAAGSENAEAARA